MRLRTLRNLLRCFTLRRLVNMAAVLISYKISDITKRSIVWGMPYTLTIEPTNRCNLSCPECPSGNGEMLRPLGIMDFDAFASLVDQISKHTFYLQLFFQGEPFINPRLADMIAFARDKGMYVAVSTNAHFIRPDNVRELLSSGLDRLIVSIDGMSEETYQEYRVGGRLSKVLDALQLLDETKRETGLGSHMETVLQFLITRGNEHEIPALRVLAGKHGAAPALKTIQVYSRESAETFLPLNEKYRRYSMEDGELRVKGTMRNRCVRLWERSVVTWDGVVVPCCFDKNAAFPLGRVNGSSFREIWQSDAYHAFRRRVLGNRRGVPMCTNCTEGLKVYR